MLTSKLNQINQILDNLIKLTKEDINLIKEAKHEELFSHISLKENLAKEFSRLKSEIDSILASRNRPIEEIFSPEEEVLFNEFRNKLNEFNTLHKHFSRLSIVVNNFYTTLLNKIKNKQTITYDKDYTPNSLKLKA